MGLKLAYIGLTLIILAFIYIVGSKTINTTFIDIKKAKKKKTQLIIGLIAWQAYVFTIASTGILESYELPPRFPLFLILPAFVFTGVFIYRNRNNAWIQNIKPETLIYVQVFRILVEIIFVFSISAGVLHTLVTIEGYNFDMIFGFTAPIIAYLVFKAKLLPVRIVVIWNYLGLAVLTSVIFLFLTATFLPELYDSKSPLIPLEATKYPYVLVASFLMPSAVFFHILSIVQLRKTQY